jgi:hypothetical protein
MWLSISCHKDNVKQKKRKEKNEKKKRKQRGRNERIPINKIKK